MLILIWHAWTHLDSAKTQTEFGIPNQHIVLLICSMACGLVIVWSVHSLQFQLQRRFRNLSCRCQGLQQHQAGQVSSQRSIALKPKIGVSVVSSLALNRLDLTAKTSESDTHCRCLDGYHQSVLNWKPADLI